MIFLLWFMAVFHGISRPVQPAMHFTTHQLRIKKTKTWWFKVTFWGWLSDLQLGNKRSRLESRLELIVIQSAQISHDPSIETSIYLPTWFSHKKINHSWIGKYTTHGWYEYGHVPAPPVNSLKQNTSTVYSTKCKFDVNNIRCNPMSEENKEIISRARLSRIQVQEITTHHY